MIPERKVRLSLTLSLSTCCRAGVRVGPRLQAPLVLPRALPQQEHLEERVCARLHLVSPPPAFIFFCCSLVRHGCFPARRFISHGITHCYSSFRGDVRGTAPSFYWMYLLSVCAGGGAWLLLWATVDRCGRRGILLLSMTMMGLASLILLGLMKCKCSSTVSGTFTF